MLAIDGKHWEDEMREWVLHQILGLFDWERRSEENGKGLMDLLVTTAFAWTWALTGNCTKGGIDLSLSPTHLVELF